MDHILTTVDNIAAKGWANRGSVSLDMEVRTILRELTLMTRGRNIYASVGHIKGSDNPTTNAASRLIHIPNWVFLHHFELNFP